MYIKFYKFFKQIFEVKQDPSGKKKQKAKKVFKTAISKDGYSKNGHTDDLDRKISDLMEENRLKLSMKEQVLEMKK